MKVFNLTNRETPTLKRLGQMDMPINVGGQTLMPGTSITVKESQALRQELSGFVSSGAIAFDRPPEGWSPVVSPVSPSVEEQPEDSAPLMEEMDRPTVDLGPTTTAEEKPEGDRSGRRRRGR